MTLLPSPLSTVVTAGGTGPSRTGRTGHAGCYRTPDGDQLDAVVQTTAVPATGPLRPHAAGRGWRPRSADPAAELPGLILALDERHGPFNPITRIMVGMAGWDPSRPRRLQVGGPAGCRAVRIGWFATMPAGLLIATSARGQRTDLLTVPSDGSDQAARAAMDQAPGPATAVTLPPSWPPSPGRPGWPAPQPGRRLRAPGWAPGNGRAASCTTTRRRPPARGPRLRPGRHARSLPRPARDAHDQRRRHRPPHRQPSANRPGRRPHYRQATWRPGLRRRPGTAGAADRHASSRHPVADSRTCHACRHAIRRG